MNSHPLSGVMGQVASVAQEPVEIVGRTIPKIIERRLAESPMLLRSHGLNNVVKSVDGQLVARRVFSPVPLSSLVIPGDGTSREIAQKGIIGLGTVHAENDGVVLPGIGGELIFLGGPWLIDGSGKARRVPQDAFTPYAALAAFDPHHQFLKENQTLPKDIRSGPVKVDEIVRQIETTQRCVGRTPPFEFDANKAYVMRVIAERCNLKLRCTSPPKKRGESLESLSRDFEIVDDSFFVIGVHVPKNDASMPEEAGWRFSAIRSTPGMDCEGSSDPVDGGRILSGNLSQISAIEICVLNGSLDIFANDEEIEARGIPFRRPETRAVVVTSAVTPKDKASGGAKDFGTQVISTSPVKNSPQRQSGVSSGRAASVTREATPRVEAPRAAAVPDFATPTRSLTPDDIMSIFPASTVKSVIAADTFNHKKAAVLVANYVASWFLKEGGIDEIYWIDLAAGRVPFVPLVTFGAMRARNFKFGVLDIDRKELSGLSDIQEKFPRNVTEKRLMNGDILSAGILNRLAASLEAPAGLVSVISTGMTIAGLLIEKIRDLSANVRQRLKPKGLWIIHDEFSVTKRTETKSILQENGFTVEEMLLAQADSKWQGVLIAKMP